ncbi:MAG: glycosyltransferase family 2 protein [Syntrophomonadaceae bacterium]|nr:glycosyltransferase family 2 protein [Syntrophomonadaceae bacterium]
MTGKGRKQKIIAMMPVRNEADRYLKEVLAHLVGWVDSIVILDDSSEDDSVEVACQFEKVNVYKNDNPLFASDEPAMRLKLWELAVAEKPDWIVAVDADEIFEDRIINEIDLLLNQDDFHAISFRVFDFWSKPGFYRIDGGWNPWQKSLLFMARYSPGLDSKWLPREVHCGRFPQAYENRAAYYSDIRVKHYGWLKPEDHYSKYLYYRDKDLKVFGEVRQFTQSIQAPSAKIQIEKWEDAKNLYFLNGDR